MRKTPRLVIVVAIPSGSEFLVMQHFHLHIQTVSVLNVLY